MQPSTVNNRNMGTYINLGNAGFQRARKGEYVDKSGLIAIINDTLSSEREFSCVTRCRRFGKSMAAKMLCAYYDHSCDSRSLFADLEIAQHPTFEEHLNKYPVIYLDMTNFAGGPKRDDIVDVIQAAVKADVVEAFPEVPVGDDLDLMASLIKIHDATGRTFFFIIDEWDAICREYPVGAPAMDNYVNWLRRMFKSVNGSIIFAGVYMTGILPIKKFRTESALNNFREYSMVTPRQLAPYFGFTKDEVRALAAKHGMDFDDLEKWYDGYQIGDQPSMFNPNSVIQAVDIGHCRSFWAQTGAYDTVANYISMNFDGLKDDVIRMLAGERVSVDPAGFQNDMAIIETRDDVLTVLIHLGYLGYDWREEECYIPNREVRDEMVRAVRSVKWQTVYNAIEQSHRLLRATLEGDAEAVARGVEAVHDDSTSILSYNDENSLACVISLAFYYARNDYIIHREYASGKGFADIVLIPRKNVDSPAVVIELKVNRDADSALDQIRRKQYPAKVAEYADRLLLVGINYDRETKQHNCRIERHN